MNKVISVINVLGILWKIAIVTGKQCVKSNHCACVFDDGSGTIDLSPIGHKDGTAVFVDRPSSTDAYWYSYNPCGTFYEAACVNVAVCQYDPVKYVFQDIGVPDKVSFNYNGLYVVAQYQSQDGFRNTFVTLVCDQRKTQPALDVIGGTTGTDYYMTLTTVAACPVPSPQPSPEQEGGGLSTGSILLIIFFVLLFVYLAVGVTFNKVWRDFRGIEVIPNSEFWATLPGLVRDGCALSLATVCRKRSVYVSM
ncbi:uncharacterized protein LOC123531309 isoform X2 [Mercenaria mercenaria]|uniref:uncharacterized protein LOC123531309 isoform X2 n=1 Tax=Mercenaria mercenaria TaxID=6596 RepID=UPI00234F8D2B|nr:uncharacterized protein LOC123531309 isoform X2 [Mercenaria mercenaria]